MVICPRSELKTAYKTSTLALNAYLESTTDRLLQLVYQHETTKKLYSVNKETRKFKTELGMSDHTRKQNEPVTKYAKRVKSAAKQKALDKLKDKLEGKPMHGQYPKRLGKPVINQDSTHQWMRNSGLKVETEGFITAAQGQSLVICPKKRTKNSI